MVSERDVDYNGLFETAIRKLGWLPAYARQVLMTRHMLRKFGELDELYEMAGTLPDVFPLDCLRSAITILTGVNLENKIFSSPYTPLDRPDTCFIAYNRKRRIFEATSASGEPAVTFHSNEIGNFGFESAFEHSIEDQLFAVEIQQVGKGVSLSTKQIASDRAKKLTFTALWAELRSPEEKEALRFFDHWQLKQPSVHSFWREWYQGFLDGKPLDWELQRRVALIDDAIWDTGPEAVAEEIERIRAEYLAEKTPQAERLEFNPETGKFFTVPVEIAKPDLLGATLTQVEDALEDVLTNPSNGLRDGSREVRVLRRIATKYGNDPQQIEMGLVSVHAGLTRQILNDELPPSEENLALQAAVEEGARAIRATHSEVAENRKILSEQVIRELPDGAKEKLEDALPILRAISDPELADDWDHDIPTLINDATTPLPSGAPALPGADETTRIFSRAAKISLHLKVADVIHRVDGSAGYKAARIVTTIAALVALGIAIV